MERDLVSRYVRFHFAEYEIDPYGWVTKNPYTIAEFAEIHGLGEPCPHCGEVMRWIDMFKIAWCTKMFWGDTPLKKGEETCSTSPLQEEG